MKIVDHIDPNRDSGTSPPNTPPLPRRTFVPDAGLP
jgi:hypothetical protein